MSAGHDSDRAPDAASVAHTVNDAQSDNAYDGLSIAPVAVTVVDDDAPVTVSVTQLELSEGGSATYTVELDVAPTDDVVIDLAVDGDGDVSVSPASLTFTAADWSTAQQVEVSAGHDDDRDNDSASVTHTVNDAATATTRSTGWASRRWR